MYSTQSNDRRLFLVASAAKLGQNEDGEFLNDTE